MRSRSRQAIPARPPSSGWVAPLYPKLRLTAEDLIAYAGDFLPLMVDTAGAERRGELKVDPRFVLGGQYLRELYALDLAPTRVRELATTALFSRYVGVIRFSLGEEWFADVVCDTTDIKRDVPLAAPVLAMLPRDPRLVDAFRTQMEAFAGAGRMAAESPVVV